MISIIVPFFNEETTLERCVNSIREQTCGDLEILLIDDGSTDGSGRIADTYTDRDDRIRVFHKENGGLSSARNYALDYVSGDWIAFVDADDHLEPAALETAVGHALRERADICVFGRRTETPDTAWDTRPAEACTVIGPEEALRRLLVTQELRFAAWDKVYRRAIFEGLRFPEGYNYEDRQTIHKALLRAGRIVLIPDILYHYVQYSESIVHDDSLKNRLDHWTASLGLYEMFGDREDLRGGCLRLCAFSIYRAWGALAEAGEQERARGETRIREIMDFAGAHYSEILREKLCKPHTTAAVLLVAAFGTAAAPLVRTMIRIHRKEYRIRQKRYSRTFSK